MHSVLVREVHVASLQIFDLYEQWSTRAKKVLPNPVLTPLVALTFLLQRSTKSTYVHPLFCSKNNRG